MLRQLPTMYKSLQWFASRSCKANSNYSGSCYCCCTRQYASSVRRAMSFTKTLPCLCSLPLSITGALAISSHAFHSCSCNHCNSGFFCSSYNNSSINSKSTICNAISHYTQRRCVSLGSHNPYATLGIKQGATKEEIKKAYRVMARKHHPDAPGGDHKKFQEIQEAYDQIKSGVWIQRGGSAGGGGSADGDGADGDGGGEGNRYSGFRYTTRTHAKTKVSYDEFYTEMHTGKVKKNPFEDDEDMDEGDRSSSSGGGEGSSGGGGKAGADPRRNPFLMNELSFQAWMRFILMWCILFSVLRVVLFFLFPPHWEKPQRKPPPRDMRRRSESNKPAPKPLARAHDALVAERTT